MYPWSCLRGTRAAHQGKHNIRRWHHVWPWPCQRHPSSGILIRVERPTYRSRSEATCSFAICLEILRDTRKCTLWNTHVYDDNVRHVCDTCLDKGKSESCLVMAPAMHASESVLVIGELLCTGVQANAERHTRNETREMCSCWGYKQHSSSRNSREWRDSNFQQSSRLANLGS